ncbi:MAG TPA: outer membrane beta-barrel protein [Saprospiraceae bacterium]|nr:outer membrane beta-barrel protein [Lewinellaceae bacterium]HRX29851.1 outer membrane beta-barrel protein [Saprospiraceae bacterium]
MGAFFSANAQFGVGAGLLYGTDSDFGYFGRLSYKLDSKLSFNATYSLLHSESIELFGVEISAKSSSIDLEANYALGEQPSHLYVLGGLSIVMAKATAAGQSESDSQIGFNVGAGYNIAMSDAFDIFLEGKYSIVKDADQAIFLAGGRYNF